MWRRVSETDSGLLERCLAIGEVASPPGWCGNSDERLAQLHFEVGTGAVELYYYAGSTFEIAAHYQYRNKNGRYLVCFAVEGAAEASTVLDRIIEQAREFGQLHGVDQVYSLEPREPGSALLKDLYELSALHPLVCKELLSEMSDQLLYRISYREMTGAVAESGSVRSVATSS
jgi:hypothetical protein